MEKYYSLIFIIVILSLGFVQAEKDIQDYELSQDKVKAIYENRSNSLTGFISQSTNNPLVSGIIIFITVIVGTSVAVYIIKKTI
ncbi:MAG: hypothetical protein Q7S27_07410 [Nanoarchaeota archaeon]|nr:hypothetical protein [Nanoarchaeota archaeon]